MDHPVALQPPIMITCSQTKSTKYSYIDRRGRVTEVGYLKKFIFSFYQGITIKKRLAMGKGGQINHYNKRMKGECHQQNGNVWDPTV